jgi:SAM-dependent methyltransferase
VLGEAISNTWDADSENVHIYIDKDKNSFFIKDDGSGMTAEDFQKKFLKIGYSKRKEGNTSPKKSRPYIGRKGIGKLALLSCAEKITVISKIQGEDYVGGVIDNSGLDRAITEDLTPKEYSLGKWEPGTFGKYTKNHYQGTIIYFENIKDGIKNSLTLLKKTIALYFRFSLIDPSFNIFVNDERVTLGDLDDLAQRTQFLWNINDLDDPYISEMLKNLKNSGLLVVRDGNYNGFIASVEKPRDLKIINIEERLGVDLFVNGRLRERDILKHIPTARVVESYLYGQIHYNELDTDAVDRFTSSRESIVADDPKYLELLESVKKHVITEILDDWDKWRIQIRNDGDPENIRISKKERKAKELYNVVSEEYILPKGTTNKKKVDEWVNNLSGDASYNFASYAECFISENLIREFIKERSISLTPDALRKIEEWREKEAKNKTSGNINIDLRLENNDVSYLDMRELADIVDVRGTVNCLPSDAKQYKPIRDALMHTARLTDEAKRKLTTVYDNIKGRIKALLNQ